MNKQQLIDYIKSEMNRWNLDGNGQTIEVEPLGLSVNICTVIDEYPDLSWLGELKDKPEGSIACDRKTGLVTQEDRGSFPELPEGWEYDRLDSYCWEESTTILVVDVECGTLAKQYVDLMGYAKNGPETVLAQMNHVSADFMGYGMEMPEAIYRNAIDGLSLAEIEEEKVKVGAWLVAVNEWARTHTPDGELILSDDGPARWGRGEYQYFIPANDLGDDYELEYILQDWKRLEDFYDNRWGMYGLRLTIMIEDDNTPVFDETQWSLELDGGKDDQEQIEEAISELLSGFGEEYLTARAEELRQQAETLVAAAAKLGQGVK